MTPAVSRECEPWASVSRSLLARRRDALQEMFFIAVGGALGATVRYGAGLATQAFFGARFPAGTLLVNIVGCFIIGFLALPVLSGEAMRPARLGLIVGFTGALTTFSAFGFETVQLYQQRGGPAALGNIAANLMLGLGAVVLGVALAGTLRPDGLSGALPRASLRRLTSGPGAEGFEAIEPPDRLQVADEARAAEADDNG